MQNKKCLILRIAVYVAVLMIGKYSSASTYLYCVVVSVAISIIY